MSRPSVSVSQVATAAGSPFDNFILPGQSYNITSNAAMVSPTSSSNGSDGSFVAVGSATARRYDALIVTLSATLSGYNFMVEVGVDAAGGTSYSAIGYHMVVDVASSAQTNGARYIIPCNIAAGSTIAVRSRHDVNSSAGAVAVSIEGISYTTAPSSSPTCTEIGFNIGTVRLTAMADPGGTANTFGAWTQLIASTAADYKGFIPMAAHRQGAGSTDTANFLVEIGTGAAAAETAVAAFHYRTDDVYYDNYSIPMPFASTIVAGTRISARIMSTSITVAARIIDVGIVALSA